MSPLLFDQHLRHHGRRHERAALRWRLFARLRERSSRPVVLPDPAVREVLAGPTHFRGCLRHAGAHDPYDRAA